MKDNNKKILNRLKRIRGQIDGVINMIEKDKYCMDVSNQLMAIDSAIKSANREILSNHLKTCVYDSIELNEKDDIKNKIEEIESIIMRLGK